MRELVAQYEESLRGQKLSENTLSSYLRDLEAFFGYLKSHNIKNALTVKKEAVDAYIEDLKESGRANSTISRNAAALRKFYHFMLLEGRVKTNPVYGVEVPRVEKKLPEAISHREILKLLKQPKTTDLKGIRDRAMLELLYATGIKVSELINLALGDVDVRGGMLSCSSGKNQRYIPIGKAATEALEVYIKKARPLMLGENKVKNLFVNCSGTALTRQGFWKILRSYAQSAGIKTEINAQTLRNCFALHLLENGADINAVSQMLGHTDVVTTRIYNQVLRNNIKKIYKKAQPRA